jgi:hypothetical protein
MTITSPWAEIDERLLNEAAQVLHLNGEDVTLRSDGEFVRFAKYGDDWCVVAEGIGDFSYVGSCMSAQRAEPILRRLINASRPKQLSLWA